MLTSFDVPWLLLLAFGLMAIAAVSIAALFTRRLGLRLRRLAACGVYASVCGMLFFCVSPVFAWPLGLWVQFVETFLMNMGFKGMVMLLQPFASGAVFAMVVFMGVALGAALGWWLTRE